jgi:hypothetical protein
MKNINYVVKKIALWVLWIVLAVVMVVPVPLLFKIYNFNVYSNNTIILIHLIIISLVIVVVCIKENKNFTEKLKRQIVFICFILISIAHWIYFLKLWLF